MQAGERGTGQRVALVLGGTAVVSAATARFFLTGGADRLVLAAGYALYLALAIVGSLVAPSFRGRSGASSETVWRLGVAALVAACLVAAFDRHLTVASLAIAPDDVALVAVVVALPVAALSPLRFARREAIVLLGAFTFYALLGIALVAARPYDVDPPAVPHRAVEHLLAGEQPYAATDAQEALARFGIPLSQGTRLEDGTFLRSLNYPALALLVPAPFVALGLADLRYLYLVEVLLLAALVLARARARWRPHLAAALIGNVVVARQEILAGTDPLWALLVATAWVFRRHLWISGLALGLATADRQPAWVVAPFVLVAIARGAGWPRAARVAAIAAAAFLLTNLPFFVTAPSAYLGGITAPLLAPLVPNGVGLVSFALYGPLPLLPRAAYGALALVVVAALLVAAARSGRAAARPVLVYPLVALWVAWRSLQNYFAFAGLFALLGDDEIVPADGPAPSG